MNHTTGMINNHVPFNKGNETMKKSTTSKSVKKAVAKKAVAKKAVTSKKSTTKKAVAKKVTVTKLAIRTAHTYTGNAVITPFIPALINRGSWETKPGVYAPEYVPIVNPLLTMIKTPTKPAPMSALTKLMGNRPTLSPLQKLMAKQPPANAPVSTVVGHVKMKNRPIHQNLTGKTVLTHRVLKPSTKSKVCIDINNAIDTYDFTSKKALVDFLITNTNHKPVTIKTYVTDGFNPKYCRLTHLLAINDAGFIDWVLPTPANPFTVAK